jgi:hypothetical protein
MALLKTLAEECRRFGVELQAVCDLSGRPAAISDAMLDDEPEPEAPVRAYCLRCYAEVAPDVRECFDCQERRERREARNDAGVD